MKELTAAQLDIIQMMADGVPTEDIAEKRGTSPWTVRTQIQDALIRLNVNTRAGAVAICLRQGLIV